ncbi:MAG: hypothetical protein WCK70_02850 [Chloroflexales bacterium]
MSIATFIPHDLFSSRDMPMLTSTDIETALRSALPPELHSHLASIAQILQAAASGELSELRAEILRVAVFWKPHLNDGVQISAAPLWRLFPHKPWQKKLKETWESLERGDYDWAHLASSIWLARVREKCITDKSLAIAHGREVYVDVAPPKAKRGKKKQAPEDEGMFEGE